MLYEYQGLVPFYVPKLFRKYFMQISINTCKRAHCSNQRGFFLGFLKTNVGLNREQIIYFVHGQSLNYVTLYAHKNKICESAFRQYEVNIVIKKG